MPVLFAVNAKVRLRPGQQGGITHIYWAGTYIAFLWITWITRREARMCLTNAPWDSIRAQLRQRKVGTLTEQAMNRNRLTGRRRT